MGELSLNAQAVLHELSKKMTFMEQYIGQNMTDEILKEVKQELDVFVNWTKTSEMRLAYDKFCHNPEE